MRSLRPGLQRPDRVQLQHRSQDLCDIAHFGDCSRTARLCSVQTAYSRRDDDSWAVPGPAGKRQTTTNDTERHRTATKRAKYRARRNPLRCMGFYQHSRPRRRRRRRESNPGRGFCRPLPSHSATSPRQEGGQLTAPHRADDRDRTGDLNLGKVALYQLSYVRERGEGTTPYRTNYAPVDPKPSVPRTESGSSSTTVNSGSVTGITMSWPIRSPRSMVNCSSPRLISTTLISPR